jgi:hypothetical protein
MSQNLQIAVYVALILGTLCVCVEVQTFPGIRNLGGLLGIGS